MMRLLQIFSLAGLLLTFGCSQNNSPAPVSSPESKAGEEKATNQQVFEVRGEIKEVRPEENQLVIKHEEIPNYMPAMTMPFDVRQTNELQGLNPGDQVSFSMVVTEREGWIENIRKLSQGTNAVADPTPQTQRVRLVREVEPLEVGDIMPDYTFTNQLGRTVRLSDFKGQALAFTFIFTRCPFPNFCPRMNFNFRDAYEILLKPGGPTNWHFLSISFDPEYDTPDRLRSYAEGYAPPGAKKWDFLTGALIEIDAITEQFGLYFTFNNGTFDHNLRTVVINAAGKVHHVFIGNEWKGAELAEKMVEAAEVKN